MDYTRRAALLCCTCYIVLLVLSLIPPQSLFGVEFGRANILSDLISFNADTKLSDIELLIDDTEYEVDLEQVEREVGALDLDSEISSDLERSFSWPLEGDELLAAVTSEQPTVREVDLSRSTRLLEDVELTPIENYDTTELTALSRLYRKLIAGDSLVRVAVLGDSFIEADILTSDLREALQSHFGGCGVGFTPMHSPLTQYRSTIKTESKGWTSHNVMQRRKTPEPYASLFSVSGWVSIPDVGASTTWRTTSVREHIDSCQCARLHFVALAPCKIEVSVNGGASRTFTIDQGSELLRQIELRQNNIRSVTMRLVSGREGFVGYGAIFEGELGVVVDNYSVRSNNGQAMFWTAPAINAQIDKAIGGYDLVILQYGLNIMQSGVSKYTSYGAQVEKMIAYCQHCFPRAAILVMGVSDRSIKQNGVYTPMREAVALTDYQRGAAKAQGVGFWSTYDAMQAQGSMSKFVERGWAAKDFTHINLKGGRQMAWALTDALVAAIEREREFVVNKVEYAPIIDSLNNRDIERELLKTQTR